MSVIASRLDTRSDAFRANAERTSGLVEELRAKVRAVKEGGGERARERHLGRGKLLPRDRLRTLLDPVPPFLEFSQLPSDGLYSASVPSAGFFTGLRRFPVLDSAVVFTVSPVHCLPFYPLTPH